MFLVLTMLFDPATGWERAVKSGRSVLRTLFLHLFPMLLLGCIAEGYGMTRWGKPVGDFGARKTYELAQIIPLQLCHFAAAVIVVCICAVVLATLADTFQQRQKFSQALLVSVFALGPVFLMRVADAFPAINPWLSWGIGAVLVVAFLYQGLPRALYLDPAHALGFYLSSSIMVVLLAGLSRLVMLMVVQPRLLGTHVG
jgi:hypothetical protein